MMVESAMQDAGLVGAPWGSRSCWHEDRTDLVINERCASVWQIWKNSGIKSVSNQLNVAPLKLSKRFIAIQLTMHLDHDKHKKKNP